eukprot:CAMPEP_0181038592 /NCGR_PEP_ID=MMETSP1070-20121207/10010_1 /TAXON_ID=265543 /ORGANISM="Minutocellus polymorphus, Strain NH13" /LENGTH=43 /DNA_ID= /DNA_START= /DNA_END= /DNA_ORIENTATION=
MNMPMAPNAEFFAASGSSRPPTKKDWVDRITPTQRVNNIPVKE